MEKEHIIIGSNIVYRTTEAHAGKIFSVDGIWQWNNYIERMKKWQNWHRKKWRKW